MRKLSSGFTLIELMVVIVIVGILAAIGGPTYKKYVLQAKKAEALTIIPNIIKSEIKFHMENGYFFNLYWGSVTNSAGGKAPASLGTVELQEIATTVGYPVAVEQSIYFYYSSLMGKVDASGTDDATSSPLGSSQFYSSRDGYGLPSITLIDYSTGDDAVWCDIAPPRPTAADLGVSTTDVSFDWFLIAAAANLDGVTFQNGTPTSSSCTMFFQILTYKNGEYSHGPVVELIKE